MIEIPLVSVVMPTYNSEKTIRQSIESVINQSYQNWELIIVDNCSTDKTRDIVNEFLENKRIRLLVNDQNYGIAFSRNRAIQTAIGKYIAFLDSDDLWAFNKLIVQVDFMEKNKYDFTFSSNYIITEDGKIIKEYICPSKVDYGLLLKFDPIHTLTIMIKSDILKRNLMPDIKDEDYATWLIIMKQGVIGYGISEKLSYFRVSKGSVNSNKFKTLTWAFNVYRKILKFNWICSFYCVIRFACYTIAKHAKYKRVSSN